MRKNGIAVLAAITVFLVFCVGRETRLAAQPAEHEAGISPAAGANCLVYLRGDAAGVSYHDRVADMGNLITRKGTVVRADDTWLVLKSGDRQSYIPRTSIMLIEVSK